MRIVIIGAAGRQATCVIRDLAESPEVEKIVLADLEKTKETLEQRSKSWGNNKSQIEVVDVNDPKRLHRVIQGSTAAANCTTHHLNLKIMEVCLLEGVHYVDMGGLFYVARKQMALSDKWTEKGNTAVLGMASAPGIVNVMTRYAVDLLDSVETINIRDGIVNFTKLNIPLATPYAFGTILEEFIMNAYIFENGEWQEVPPFWGGEIVDFPPPVGTQTAYCTLHSETATVPVTFGPKGLKNMSFKLALPSTFEQKVRFLIDLGLGSNESLSLKVGSVVPRDLLVYLIERLQKPQANSDDHKALRVGVKGVKNGEPLEIRVEMMCHPYDPWQMGTGPFSVGFPVGLTCRLLGNGTITARGAFPAEACIPPEPFFKGLAARGLHAGVTIKKSIS